MSALSIKMPDIGEGMAEAEIVEWHVAIGEDVKEDQLIAAVMTDKATVEIPSPHAGKVLGLGGKIGEMIAIGAELIRLDVVKPSRDSHPANDTTEVAPAPSVTKAPAPSVAVPAPKPSEAPPASKPKPHAPTASRLQAALRPRGGKPLASPAVRRQAQDAGIDLRFVPGSGPAQRITHEDLERFAAGGAPALAQAARQPNLHVSETAIVGLRRKIAHNMAESTRRIAHFSYVEEVDVTALEELRARLNERVPPDGARLTLIPLLMLALRIAVSEFPQMNAHFDDDKELLRQFGALHVGIATQTAFGLTVPVIRHVETRSVWDCAEELKRLSDAARSGKAPRDELSGSTITITSLGALGGIVTTPVINRPEVAIVGVNKIAIRPVWRDNAFMPRKIMNLSSSFDHRVIDGYDAALFVQRLRALLETPALLFVEA